MNTNTACPLRAHVLDHLSDDELLDSTRRLIGRSNQIFAALLAHLAEVEARGLHRLRACSSLYAYCIYELRLSEDEAFRRVSAARLVKRFPALFGAIERGELHLTGLLMLGPLLTADNHLEVLAHAKHRTKKEIAKLVRQLDPLPDVPPQIVPLGPAPARSATAKPSWDEFARSMNPVRELPSGDRPADWTADALEPDVLQNDALQSGALQLDAPTTAPARVAPPLVGPQRYRVQFTTDEEYVNLVERAKALLSHAAPNTSIAELHLRAMRALVAALEKRKYGVNSAPEASAVACEKANGSRPAPNEDEPARRTNPTSASDNPRQRGRSIPAAIKRSVFARDGARCSYVDPTTGQRCHETRHLELHHETAYARGGVHRASNLTLRCTAHNALAAEMDFGRDFIARRKDVLQHEPCSKQSTRSTA